MRQFGGKQGTASMKATGASIIMRGLQGSRLTPQQLEAKLPLGLKGNLYDVETGQAVRRLLVAPDHSRIDGASLEKLAEILKVLIEDLQCLSPDAQDRC